jgi:hypothetical protein
LGDALSNGFPHFLRVGGVEHPLGGLSISHRPIMVVVILLYEGLKVQLGYLNIAAEGKRHSDILVVRMWLTCQLIGYHPRRGESLDTPGVRR